MTYSKGNWKICCEVCGFEFLNTEVKKRWDGLIVCENDFELDHPQKYIRVEADGLPVPLIRREPADQFVGICTIFTKQNFADIGTADCATVGTDKLNLTGYDNLVLASCPTNGVLSLAGSGTANCMSVGRTSL